MNQKFCNQCNEMKSLDCFTPLKGGVYGLHPRCKPCRIEHQNELKRISPHKYKRRTKQKPATRDQIRKYKYNLTPHQYAQILIDQKGVCAICGHIPMVKTLVVDHCHKTDKVRGLLCGHCNTGLGMFRDNIENLLSAISYLNK